jgi:MFS family permease
MMALMNALVGVGAVIYYSTDVFRAAGIGGTNGAEFASLAVGGVNFLAAIVSVFLTDRFGRRPLLSIGLVAIAVCLAVAGIILVGPGAEQGGLLVAAILGYMAFFAISAGPLAWLLLSEVLPGIIRARAAAIATAANWGANLLITLLFPLVVGSPGDPERVGMAFWFFGVLTLGFLAFVRLRVPETRGRTLERIEADLRGSR